MATRTWEGTVNAKWNEKLNWSGATEPTAADDVVLPSGAPALTIDTTGAACRSLEAASGYKNTLKMNANITLLIGTTTSNGGKCLKLNSELTFTLASTSKIEFVANHSTTEEITTATRIMPNLTFNGGSGAIWKLLDKLEMGSATTLIGTKGTRIETNNQELNVGAIEIANELSGGLKAGTSLIKLSAPSGTTIKFAAPHNAEAIGSATFEFTGTGTGAKNVKSFGTETIFGTLVIACEGVNFVESVKCKVLKVETKGKTTAATKFLKSGKAIVTTTFTTNATSGAEVLIESTTKGTTFEFTYEGGTLEGLDWLKLEDCKAADSTHYYAGANSTLTNSANWKKEAAPSASTANPLVMIV